MFRTFFQKNKKLSTFLLVLVLASSVGVIFFPAIASANYTKTRSFPDGSTSVDTYKDNNDLISTVNTKKDGSSQTLIAGTGSTAPQVISKDQNGVQTTTNPVPLVGTPSGTDSATQNYNASAKEKNAARDTYNTLLSKLAKDPNNDSLRQQVEIAKANYQQLSNVSRAAANAAGIAEAKQAEIDSQLCNTITDIFGCTLKAGLTFLKWIIWYLLVPFLGMLTRVTATILDTAVDLSLTTLGLIMNDSNGAINSIWVIVRDFVNIALIFSLLWVAIATILQVGGHTLKKTVTTVVIAALLVNFSLFFTKVFIDASNLVAVNVYNAFQTEIFKVAVSVKSPDSASGITPETMTVGSALGYATRIQSFIEKRGDVETDTVAQFVNSYEVGIIMIVVSAVLVWALWSGAMIFIVRTAMLLMLAAFSPIGFLFGAIPQLSGYASKWRTYLWEACIAAPVFTFMLLLFAKILSIQSLFANLVGIRLGEESKLITDLFNFVFVIFIFIQAVKVTKSISGEAGKMADKLGGKLTGLAMGVTGGAASIGLAGSALLARATIGETAKRLANSERFKDFAAKTGTVGRLALRSAEGVSKSSLDIRNTGLGSYVAKTSGVNLTSVAGVAKGGRVGADERKDKAYQEHVASLGYDRNKVYAEENILRGHQNDLAAAKRLANGTPAEKAARKVAMDTAQAKIDASNKRIEEIKIERQRAYTDTMQNSRADGARTGAAAGAALGTAAVPGIGTVAGAVVGGVVGAVVGPRAAAVTGTRRANNRASAQLEVREKEAEMKLLEGQIKKKQDALDRADAEKTRIENKQKAGIDVGGVWYERDRRGGANMAKEVLSTAEKDSLTLNKTTADSLRNDLDGTGGLTEQKLNIESDIAGLKHDHHL